MKVSKNTYLILGLAAILGVCAFAIQNLNSGFCTDAGILTMELPQKEGYNTNPTFTLEASLPDVPKSLGIYKMTVPTVSVESTQALADLRGIAKRRADPGITSPIELKQLINRDLLVVQEAPAAALKMTMTELAKTPLVNLETAKMLDRVVDLGAVYSFATTNNYLSVDKSSAAETVLLNYPSLTATRMQPLPSEDVLKMNADAYAVQNNLLPTGYQYSGMTYLTRQNISQNGLEGSAENILGIAKYSRTLEGLPVEGAGSTICVLLGEGGEAQGYTKVSRDIGEKIAVSTSSAPGPLSVVLPGKLMVIKPDELKIMQAEKTYELLTPQEAFEILQQRGLTTEIADLETATVTDVHLAYYEGEPSKKQEDTEPIYVFSGTATGPAGTVEYKEFMYALKTKNAQAPFEMTSAGRDLQRKAEKTLVEGTKDPELIS